MDVLVAMRTFRRVVERDSFSLAAADLGQSAAAVSKQVRQLEERLGSLLILRTTRRMSLSEAGQAYFSECCHLLDELDALERATQVGASEPSGRLRVNSTAVVWPQGTVADPGGVYAALPGAQGRTHP